MASPECVKSDFKAVFKWVQHIYNTLFSLVNMPSYAVAVRLKINTTIPNYYRCNLAI